MSINIVPECFDNTFFYKHNDYKHIEAEISEKTRHIVSIFLA